MGTIRFVKMLISANMALSLSSCNTDKAVFVTYNDPHIVYEGRIDTTKVNGAQLYWSGTSIKLNFHGASIAANMKDSDGDNYYNISIDNDIVGVIRPDTVQREYLLASGLSKKNHTVEIFKRTEWNRGNSTFQGFRINGRAKVLGPSPSPKRKMEFYGNSITAGYAVEDYSGKDSPDSTYTNNYLSYAAITARHFKAEYRCICRSGIGITISWEPLTMPEMYDRLVPQDTTSKWDFSLYSPDVVVINLLQNDSWLIDMPDHQEFKRRFGNKAPKENVIISAYQDFIVSIREHYPRAHIICALGNMDATKKDSKWPEFIYKAVNNLNDPKIDVLIIPYKNTDNHPSKQEQKVMAQKLIAFIDENVVW
ncbi:SGNH/GDSL hydrolase family protein [Confluentibacter flavum]|nr:SGNH/GDSL hydrolase family protein [Confluentibacter flavum]